MARTSRIAALSLAFLLTACPSACPGPVTNCVPPENAQLNVPLNPQQTSMWCWAASGQMTMNFVHSGSNVQQFDEANRYFNRTDCGNSPTPAPCVNGGWPQYQSYNFTAVRTSDTALTWAQLQNEIGCAARPFAFSWHWPGGGGHMMVAIGYQTVPETNAQYVLVNDPWPPNTGDQVWMTYDRYVATPGDHTHWDDFYQITYTGS